jgi:hypothetical protein
VTSYGADLFAELQVIHSSFDTRNQNSQVN